MNEADIDFGAGEELDPMPRAAAGSIQLLANPFPGAAAPSLAAKVESSRAIADMQTARLMAQRFPRDVKTAVDRILIACTSTDLAEVATFHYARGGTEINAPSIRLAEAVCQSWGNMKTSVEELERANGYSTVRAFAIDLETGFEDEKRFQVRHWRDTKSGGYALKDERDIYELVANMAARRKRACITAVIPREVFNLAVQQVDVTLTATCRTDADAIATMLDRFERFGVEQEHIEKKIQRSVESITAAQMILLRKIYNSLKDGMGKPSGYFDIAEPEPTDGGVSLASLVAKAEGEGAAPAAATAATDSRFITFASVRTAIMTAADADALDAAESLIASIELEDQRVAAAELLRVKREAIEGSTP